MHAKATPPQPANRASQVLLLTAADIEAILPLDTAVGLMREAMLLTAAGKTLQPPRWIMQLPIDGAELGLMPGHLSEPECFGAKVTAVFAYNHRHNLPSHQGIVVLFEPQFGRPVAILNGGTITSIRTAALSAVATDTLAPADASSLAILGYGEQAEQHLRAIATVRALTAVRVWGRSFERAQSFADRFAGQFDFSVRAVESCEQAVADTAIVCTTTAATEPILKKAWLRSNAHVNLIGSSDVHHREIDVAGIAEAKLFVDLRASITSQSGEFIAAKEAGAIDDGHIFAELGEVLAGQRPGRESHEELTVFKSLGIVAEDLLSANYIVQQAKRARRGQYWPM